MFLSKARTLEALCSRQSNEQLMGAAYNIRLRARNRRGRREYLAADSRLQRIHHCDVQRGDFGRLQDSSVGAVRRQHRDVLAADALRAQERRECQPRSYRVDADAGGCKLSGERSGEVGDCCFAGAVVDRERVGLGYDSG